MGKRRSDKNIERYRLHCASVIPFGNGEISLTVAEYENCPVIMIEALNERCGRFDTVTDEMINKSIAPVILKFTSRDGLDALQKAVDLAKLSYEEDEEEE